MFKAIAKRWREIKSCEKITYYRPSYRVVNIDQDNHGDYVVTVQLISKSIHFTAKPEELIADDKTMAQFSSIDARTITYLGYLDVNRPKYKIVAKKLYENDSRMMFALHKKGERKVEVKTSAEISNDAEILNGLSQQDAHMVGHVVGAEQSTVVSKRQKVLSDNIRRA